MIDEEEACRGSYDNPPRYFGLPSQAGELATDERGVK